MVRAVDGLFGPATERAVKDLVANPVLVGPDDYRPGADRQTSFLILRKDDLLDADAVERAARALRSHFG